MSFLLYLCRGLRAAARVGLLLITARVERCYYRVNVFADFTVLPCWAIARPCLDVLVHVLWAALEPHAVIALAVRAAYTIQVTIVADLANTALLKLCCQYLVHFVSLLL